MAKKLRNCPGWLNVSADRESFIFVPERAQIVRKIFEASIGGAGCYTIAKLFNENGVPPFGPSAKWDQSTIHNMLCNRATIGEHQPKRIINGKRVPDGPVIPNFYPAVIPESIFEAAQRARQQNSERGRGRKGGWLTNVFRGRLRCAYCGSEMKYRQNNLKSLVCEKLLSQAACYRASWTYESFENSFLKFAESFPDSLWPDPDGRLDVSRMRMAGPGAYSAQSRLSASLRSIVEFIEVASVGERPLVSQLSKSEQGGLAQPRQLKRDDPNRYCRVRLRDGSLMVIHS